MSLLPMTRQCVHCRRTYRYNPSTGDLGLVCRYCGKAQCSPEPQHLPQPAFLPQSFPSAGAEATDKEVSYVHLQGRPPVEIRPHHRGRTQAAQ